ncbi:MAG: formate dehydrogenase family accessory protein FdhD [Deltaproteobacteria bacterium RBG_13_52_11]|nr:MAG: formate dehydrogenase family accessory protein FdhD [Deltaproteobacteria bacterium RBG_13_52_11]
MKGKTIIKRYPALLIQGGRTQKVEDWVAVEGSYELYLNDTLVDTIVVSPTDLEAHALGYLVTEGFLKPEEVTGVEQQGDQIFVRTATKKIIPRKAAHQNVIYRRREWGEIPVVSSTLEVSPALIIQCAQQIPEHSESWKKTGGIHCSVLFDQEGRVIKAAEDIGRWNTVDKIVGYALLHRIPLTKKILGCSGRQPEGMVLKAARAQIPIVVTKAAVIDRGIEVAERLGVTLIGFAREDRFTIYAHPERVRVAFSPHLR